MKIFPKLLLWATAALIVPAVFSPRASADKIVYHDLDTKIKSNENHFVSLRFMRHLWLTSDHVGAALVQQAGYGGRNMSLYRTTDGGKNWNFVLEVSGDWRLIGDGVIDESDDLLVVSSLLDDNPTADVSFTRLAYAPSGKTWHAAPGFPVVVFHSDASLKGSRATVAVDSGGVLWCAVRIEDAAAGEWFIKVFYSEDGGLSWNDSGQEFGTPNNNSQKCPRLIAFGPRMGLVYQDVQVTGSTEKRYKKWAWRDDSQGLHADWQFQTIAEMNSSEGDVYGAHWSAAADPSGDAVHLTYQDNGVVYTKYDVSSGSWSAPRDLSPEGMYSNISAGTNGDLYVFWNFYYGTNQIVLGKKYDASSHSWKSLTLVSKRPYKGKLRVCSPERFGRFVPLLYQVDANSPYKLLYNLIRID